MPQDFLPISNPPSQSLSKRFSQGASVPHPDIYRCIACGFEIAVPACSSLPSNRTCPTRRTRRNSKDGSVTWRLIAATIDTNG